MAPTKYCEVHAEVANNSKGKQKTFDFTSCMYKHFNMDWKHTILRITVYLPEESR